MCTLTCKKRYFDSWQRANPDLIPLHILHAPCTEYALITFANWRISYYISHKIMPLGLNTARDGDPEVTQGHPLSE